jgi:hypothetical protein
MTRLPVAAALLAALALSACATARSSGQATATMAADGTIELKGQRHGLFGRPAETVVFHPGEPGYEAMKTQIEVLDTGARKPVLTWTIGEPELILPTKPATTSP